MTQNPMETSEYVGLVLESCAVAEAVIAAIRQENAEVKIVDRGSYLRVLVHGRCVVTRAVIEQHLGRPFHLPADLELVMPAFKGLFAVSEEKAEWTFKTLS